MHTDWGEPTRELMQVDVGALPEPQGGQEQCPQSPVEAAGGPAKLEVIISPTGMVDLVVTPESPESIS